MTIPKEIIELAEKGGWKKHTWTDLADENATVLDSTFWVALGNACGWGHDHYNVPGHYWKGAVVRWRYEASRFYDLILTNSDTAAFWQEILTNPTHN